MVLVVGMAVVVAVVAGLALLVAGTAQSPGPAAAGKALKPLGMLLLRVLALPRCQQHPLSLLGTLWPHLALGQPNLRRPWVRRRRRWLCEVSAFTAKSLAISRPNVPTWAGWRTLRKHAGCMLLTADD